MAKARINTEQYEFANGKRPRGFGHWMFKISEDGREEVITVIGTYTEAVTNLRVRLKGLGYRHPRIDLLP